MTATDNLDSSTAPQSSGGDAALLLPDPRQLDEWSGRVETFLAYVVRDIQTLIEELDRCVEEEAPPVTLTEQPAGSAHVELSRAESSPGGGATREEQREQKRREPGGAERSETSDRLAALKEQLSKRLKQSE